MPSSATGPRSERGVTLIELLIVVAIIGILASLAVYMFTRASAKARASEVPAVFAEFRIRQENFHLENGFYLSTDPGNGETDADAHPSPVPNPQNGPTLVAPLPATWAQLNFHSDKNALYCSYVSVAGTPSDTPGTIAGSFGFTVAPPTNWFYMLAYCDLDSSGGNYSTYYAQSSIDGQAVRNEGN